MSRGAIVLYEERIFRITDAKLNFNQVEACDVETGEYKRLEIDEIKPPDFSGAESSRAPELADVDSAEIEEARRRQSVIGPLLNLERRTAAAIHDACEKLGIGKTTLYRWMNAYATDGRLTSLMPVKRPGGRGKSRLTAEAERLLQDIISEYHLRPPQRSVRATMREVRRRFRNAGIKCPAENTVRARIALIPEAESLRKRGHAKKAKDKFTPRPGTFDEATHPLSMIQIDHTPLDIILVDEEMRLPLKRPWLTLAIDVYSRMIVGFYISFDNPGALGTGLCIARSILRKDQWLSRLGIKTEWPCFGLPARIHVDNAKEFRGEMLRLACEQYRIELDFRPVASPSTGGHIERLIGKVNHQHIHEIAGAATKPEARGDYDSEKNAILTIPELEKRLAMWITEIYHKDYHETLMMPPLKRWTDAIMGNDEKGGVGELTIPADPERLYIDFMPAKWRTIQHYGVEWDVSYYADVLRRYVNTKRRGGSKKYLFRRDPRDISVIYFWDPNDQRHYAIRYRNGVHPPISVWELKAVRDELKRQGRAAVDEEAIFTAYEWLRKQEMQAAADTREIRRKRERKAAHARDHKERSEPRETRVLESPALRQYEHIAPLDMEDDYE